LLIDICYIYSTDGGGFAAHTYTLGMDWILNDMSINESEIIASYGYFQIIQRVVLSKENGPEIFNEFGEQLFADWVEVESGNWKPLTPRDEDKSSKKYFGAKYRKLVWKHLKQK
jgi:hypothetical protein